MSRKFETVVARSITTNEIKLKPFEGEVVKITGKTFDRKDAKGKKEINEETGEITQKHKTFMLMKMDSGDTVNLICDAGLFYAVKEANIQPKDFIRITFISQEVQKNGNKRNSYQIEKAV